ncbi:MAG: hypothetical protein ACT4PU_01220 [Planctomycetota bacterium]
MTRTLTVVFVVIVLAAWAVSWLKADAATVNRAREPWPEDLGTLESVIERFPPLSENEAARRFLKLAAALRNDDAVTAFVRCEMGRDSLSIGEPPQLANGADGAADANTPEPGELSELRELLLHTPITWERFVPCDDPQVGARRVLHMIAARALVASALLRGRAGDPAAWDDLHAVWILARSQDSHPQMMTQTAALTMARMINAVAWKLPLPAPAWLDELHAHDPVRRLIEAFQYQTASYWEGGTNFFLTKWLAKAVAHDRTIAEELIGLDTCDVQMRMNELGPDLGSVWRRAFRYRAEREATAQALRVRAGLPLRAGQAPDASSACSGGSWSFDGTTLRFSQEIPLAADELPMPLVLRLGT